MEMDDKEIEQNTNTSESVSMAHQSDLGSQTMLIIESDNFEGQNNDTDVVTEISIQNMDKEEDEEVRSIISDIQDNGHQYVKTEEAICSKPPSTENISTIQPSEGVVSNLLSSELHTEQHGSAASSQNGESTSGTMTTEPKELYLCGQCNLGFVSIEECKEHMIQDHHIKYVYRNKY